MVTVNRTCLAYLLGLWSVAALGGVAACSSDNNPSTPAKDAGTPPPKQDGGGTMSPGDDSGPNPGDDSGTTPDGGEGGGDSGPGSTKGGIISLSQAEQVMGMSETYVTARFYEKSAAAGGDAPGCKTTAGSPCSLRECDLTFDAGAPVDAGPRRIRS